jgi:hypothetical protein
MIRSLAAYVFAAFVLAFAAPAIAQDAGAPEAAWQSVITHQIEAFRQKDAVEAFSDAAQAFQETYPTAAMFFRDILRMGYSPIMDSRSHSFGAFELDAGGASVLQVVKFVGPDQQLFDALYNLTLEESGWHVSGVMLGAPSGVGV